MTTPTLQSEETLVQRLRKQHLVESVEQMSPRYLEGIKRILTVSADTQLISAPAEHLIFERDPRDFKYPYAFDIPLESWAELIVANAFYDRAGYTLLSDVYQSTTFGPWKRALLKVDKEETFHLRHGEQGARKLNQAASGHEALQQAVDWMFLLTVEWFGLPDGLKKHGEQLEYGLKGKSNDQLRQLWLATAVPFCEELGPKNEAFVGMIQRGKREMLRLVEQ